MYVLFWLFFLQILWKGEGRGERYREVNQGVERGGAEEKRK